MNKIVLVIIIILISFQISNSQPSLVTVNIKPDSLVTSGNVAFRCTITNPTKKNYGYFDFTSDCKSRMNPEFWKIIIRKSGTNYMDCSLTYALVSRPEIPEVKLHKKSTRTFDFCLNFNKLCTGTEFPDIFRQLRPEDDIKKIITGYNNESFGTYEVQIIYLKDPFDPKSPLSLISNWTKVEYVHD
jgi:hypothetical protein